MADVDALGWVERRRLGVLQRLATTERRLTEVRTARADWTDEEHDPEGFALTFEWQHAEGARADYLDQLTQLDAAAMRVDSGEYGMCTQCGHPIPESQLERTPERTTCVACAPRRR